MKKVLLLILMLLNVASADSGQYYGFIGLKANYPDQGKMQWIYEKTIFKINSHVKENGFTQVNEEKLKAKFLDFIKNNHPEYISEQAKYNNNITLAGQFQGEWDFNTKKMAERGYTENLKYVKKITAESPKDYLPVIELNDFIYSE